MEKRIFGVTGMMACGKGTVAKYFVEKYGAQSFRFSTSMRDLLDRLYLPQSRENISAISRITRAEFGQDLYAKVMARDAGKADNNIVIVEGIRRQEDVQELKKLANFKLVAIEVDMKTRWERLRLRGENLGDANKSWEEFQKDHELETELTIPPVMKTADITISNNGSLEDLYKQLDELLK
jgi:dephospho-CoA kinase